MKITSNTGAGASRFLGMAVVLLALASVPAYADVSVPDSLRQALVQLAGNNPLAAIHRAQAAGLRHQAGVVDSLPDPTLGFSLKNLPSDNPVPSGSTMSGYGFELAQSIPSLATLRAQGKKMENKAVESNRQEQDAREKALAEGVAVYVNAVAIAAAVDRFDKTEKALMYLRESAAARYRTGMGIRYDLDQIEVEIALVRALRDAASGRLEAVKASWLPLAGIPFPTILTDQGFVGWRVAQKELLAGVATAPLVAAADANRAAADDAERAARWKAFPDLAVSGGIMERPSAGAMDLNFGLKISLPLGYPWRQGKEVAVAHAQQTASKVTRNLAAYQVETEVRSQYALYNAAAKEEQLFVEQILPAGSTAVNSAQSAYQAGRGDILIPIKAITAKYRDEAEWVVRRSKRIAAAGRALAAIGLLAEKLGIDSKNNMHTTERER